jgi:transketolase
MRGAFIDELTRLAADDARITLIVGDLGFGVVQKFAQAMPNQFVNAGVAEQHMTGLAAGMAMNGRIALTYSIANFPVVRCLEQIRNDVCYHNANVKIVAVGGGMAYGSLGMTHHATEDLAFMRAMPNLLVVAPNDPVEARLATRAVLAHDGPVYVRLGRQGEQPVHTSDPDFVLGRAITMREGTDLSIIVTGGLLLNSMQAAAVLEAEHGLKARVISMHTVKPLDEEAVLAAAKDTDAVFTVEEHSIIGGLGGAVAETLLERGVAPRVFRRIGLPGEKFSSKVGDQDYLRAEFGLDAAGIVKTISAALSSKTSAR